MKKQSFHYLGTVIKDFYIEDSRISSYGHLHNMGDLPIMDGFICPKGAIVTQFVFLYKHASVVWKVGSVFWYPQ